MTTIWITRAQPEADATAARVRAMGFEAEVAPLLAVRDLPGEIDLAGVGAVAFTSQSAVRAFTARCGERDLIAFAVGDATAAAAKAARFRTVLSTAGDVRTLAAGIAARRRTLGGEVLHAAAAEPAGDLVGDLNARGVPARGVAIYETVPVDPPAAFLERLTELDGVLLHSSKAGRRLAEILGARALPRLTAYCLSPAVAATLEGLTIGPLTVAPLPNEDALLRLLPA